MTKKPKLLKPSEFTDAINQPIVGAQQEQVLRVKEAKLVWLAMHFGTSPDNPDWKFVCLRLAETCLNGFSVSSRPIRKRGRPQQFWKGLALVQQINELRDKNPANSRTVAAACKHLAKKDPKRWGKSPKTLQNQYRIWRPHYIRYQVQYQDQKRKLEELKRDITQFAKDCKVAGTYNAALDEFVQTFRQLEDEYCP